MIYLFNRIRVVPIFTVSLAVALTAGCDMLHKQVTSGGVADSSIASAIVYSCNTSNATSVGCNDFEGSGWTVSGQQSEMQTACQNMSGTFALTACPTANRLGSCTVSYSADMTQIVRYYSTATYTLDLPTAEAACQQTTGGGSTAGVFTPN